MPKLTQYDVLGPIQWLEIAYADPTVEGATAFRDWVQEQDLALPADELQRVFVFSRLLGLYPEEEGTPDQEEAHNGYENMLAESDPFRERIAEMVAALLADPHYPAVSSAVTGFVGSVSDQDLADLRRHLFASRHIQLSGENYWAWVRLATGRGTVDDDRFLVHELHELRNIRNDLRYQHVPRDETDSSGHQASLDAFGRLYATFHPLAVKAEYDFLATVLRLVTNQQVQLTGQDIATADPDRSEGRSAYAAISIDDESEAAQARRRALRQERLAVADKTFDIPEAARDRLGLAHTTVPFPELIRALRRLRSQDVPTG